jgi:hypothetical protein
MLWNFGGLNVNRSQEFSGTAYGGPFVAEFNAERRREYRLSVKCIGLAHAEQKFAVGTYATTSLSSYMPHLTAYRR